MNQELEIMTRQWMELERKTLEQREAANLFYEENLMGLIVEEYIQCNQRLVTEEVDYLVVSVGTSYEPIVLNISLLQPKQVLFLYTDKTKQYLDKIVRNCALDLSQIIMRKISGTNPLDIYREIKQVYLEWNRPEKIYIDFTGGTKSMSAAAAMAGAMVHAQLVYVGTEEYLTDFRKPRPGSERLYFIANPLKIFGDLEIGKTMTLFSERNYAGVREKLEELKGGVPEPNIRQQLTFLYLLAKMYEQWDALDFISAYETSVKLMHELKRDRDTYPNFVLMDQIDFLQCQSDVLRELSQIPEMIRTKDNVVVLETEEYIFPLIFTMYLNAMRREYQEKYDMATLLLYRVLEMIEQRRLIVYNLYVSNMQYDMIHFRKERNQEYLDCPEKERETLLKEKVFQIEKKLFGHANRSFLPERVSLLEGFIILLALEDEISMLDHGHPINKLKRIRSMVYLRNNSIFAHGLGPVGKEEYCKFRDFVTLLLKEFCEIENISFEKYCSTLRFVHPQESSGYHLLEQ